MTLKGTRINEVGNLKNNKTTLCKAIPTMSIKKGTKQIENPRRLTKTKTTVKKKNNCICKCKGYKIENQITKRNKILSRLQYI